MAGNSHHGADRRRLRVLRVRRIVLTAVAADLVVAAEALAATSAVESHTHHASRPRDLATHKAAANPYGRELHPDESSAAPRAPWGAAVKFVHKYAAWHNGTPHRDSAGSGEVVRIAYAGAH